MPVRVATQRVALLIMDFCGVTRTSSRLMPTSVVAYPRLSHVTAAGLSTSTSDLHAAKAPIFIKVPI